MSITLYHGTSGEVARRVLAGEPLRPRGRRKGNWQDTVTSNAKSVYLTDCWAPFFAAHASGDKEWGMVEVEIDERFLMPDEDWLEQGSRGATRDDLPGWALGVLRCRDMKQRTLWWRKKAPFLTELWRESLEGLGTVGALVPITSECVTRVALFDPEQNKHVAAMCIDTTISTINHKVSGPRMAALTRWFFGDDVKPSEVDIAAAINDLEEQSGLVPYVTAITEALNNRNGVAVEAMR